MSKTIKFAVITLLVGIITVLSFGAGCVISTRPSSNVDQSRESVLQAWDSIVNDYVDKDKIDSSALSQAAIKAMVEVLDDPYTSYLDAETYQLSISGLAGGFDGIGAYVGVKDEQLIIIAPIDDSPADGAGIRPGDIIIEVNGQPTADMSLDEAVLNIRGPEGTAVNLLILHDGETTPEVITIVRAKIKVPSVRFEMKEDIAYINVTHFSESTNKEFSPVLESIVREAATGLILDLRNNPGGLLQTVISVASRFLEEGVVVRVVDNEGNITTSEIKGGETTTDLPLVVLINNHSASGSEVLAGALQDYGRATIAGSTTFGKGSVNILRKLEDGSGLYITIARWFTPNGRPIEGKGIDPDSGFELELEGEDAIQWAIDYLQSKQ